MHRRVRLALLSATIVVFLLMIGCGDDNDPVAPPEDNPGTIVVDPDPDSLNAPWTLSGPDSYSNSGDGDQTFPEMSPGEYTLTWGSVTDWISPSNSTQSLVSDGTVTFSGTYVEDPGSVQDFVLIPPASVSMPVTFTMGSTYIYTETPHQVTLTSRFNMASTEVTNEQYVAVLQWAYSQGYVTVTTACVLDALDGSTADLLDLDDSGCQISFNDGVFSTSFPDRPVVDVSWYGSVAYCDWLSLQEGLPRAYDHGTWSCNSGNPYNASGYRLPTEAEWEFACRALTTTHFNTGDCLDSATEANYDGSILAFNDCPTGPDLGRTADVCSYPSNQWGLFDIHGNVYEWCNDWFGNYDGGDETNPEGAGSGYLRVTRGGSWYNNGASFCRSAYRYYASPHMTYGFFGFRPVMSTN